MTLQECIDAAAPITWRDWQQLYHQQLRAFGFAQMLYFRVRRIERNPPRFFIDLTAKTAYRYWHRINRIYKHMDDLMKAGEQTACEQMAMVVSHWIGASQWPK